MRNIKLLEEQMGSILILKIRDTLDVLRAAKKILKTINREERNILLNFSDYLKTFSMMNKKLNPSHALDVSLGIEKVLR